MCSRTCSVVKKSVCSKVSEAVEALAGVEEQLYVSLDGILGRNVKRVQEECEGGNGDGRQEQHQG